MREIIRRGESDGVNNQAATISASIGAYKQIINARHIALRARAARAPRSRIASRRACERHRASRQWRNRGKSAASSARNIGAIEITKYQRKRVASAWRHGAKYQRINGGHRHRRFSWRGVRDMAAS